MYKVSNKNPGQGNPSYAGDISRLPLEDQDKNVFPDSVFKDTDSEIGWIWHGWTWAEGLVNTGRLKGRKKIGLQQGSTAPLLILWLSSRLNSLSLLDQVNRVRWFNLRNEPKCCPPPLPCLWVLSSLSLGSTFIIIHSSKIRGQWSWRSQFLVNHCCVSEVIKLCAILFLLNP